MNNIKQMNFLSISTHIFTQLNQSKRLITGLFIVLLALLAVSHVRSQSLLDTTFNPEAGGAVYSIAVQPNGKILIGGGFGMINGQVREKIARLNEDGTLDTSFKSNVKGYYVYSIAIQPNGKILIGGNLWDSNGFTGNGIVRLNEDGTLDTTFNSKIKGDVHAITLEQSGKILIGGSLSSIDGQTPNRIARLNEDGTLDTTFRPNVNGSNVWKITLQSNGKILIGGDFTYVNEQVRKATARLNEDGTLDTTFNPNINGYEVYAITLQPNGKILIGGQVSSYDGNRTFFNIIRLNEDGTLDSTFNGFLNSTVYAITIQSSGKILVGGVFHNFVDGQKRNNCIARLNEDGTLDTAFNTNIDVTSPLSNIRAVAVQSDGKVLIIGQFNSIDNQRRSAIARLHQSAIKSGKRIRISL